MRKFFSIVVFSSLLTLCFSAYAASSIAVVDMSRLFHDAPQIQALKSRMEDQFSKQRDALLQERAAIKAGYVQVKRNKKVLSTKELNSKNKSLYARTSALQKKEVAFQQAIQKDQDDFMKQFVGMVKDMVQRIAKKQHYTLVLIKSTVVYAQDSMDITNVVLNELRVNGSSNANGKTNNSVKK
jgi:outer membrane protein